MRHSVYRGLLVLGAFALHGAPARADSDFGRAGTLAISAERLFGFAYSSYVQEIAGEDVSTHQTVFSALYDASPSSGDLLLNAYTTPRIGADYFVIPSLSVGGSLGFASGSIGVDDNDVVSGNTVLFNIRAGYAFMFTDIVGLWPRGGLTYVGARSEPENGGNANSATAWAVTLEAPLVIAPIPHVAFLVTPFWDIGFAGSRDEEITEDTTLATDTTTHAIGVQAGITGYF